MSDSDGDDHSQTSQEQQAQVPLIWKYAYEDKIGPIVKHLEELSKEGEEEDLINQVKEVSPADGQPLLMWATLKQRFVLVEWLIGKLKRDAFAFQNQTKLEIYEKWDEKRIERAEAAAQAAADLEERLADGEPPEEEEEEAEAEPELWELVKGDLGEEVDEETVRFIGENGVYEGGNDPEGNRQGLGRTLFSNGDMYIGEYRESKREGVGTYFWKEEGHIYVGQWKDNERCGLGRMIYVEDKPVEEKKDAAEDDEDDDDDDEEKPDDKKQRLRFYGSWRHDKQNGHGRYTYPNGDTYDGTYVDGRKEGNGTYTFAADNSKYQGTWHNGDFTSGKWIQANNTVYYGSFKDFKPIGKGVFVFRNKYKQEGFYTGEKWKPLKVDNLSPDSPADYLIHIQRRPITLRFTPEGEVQDKHNGIPSLVGVSNFPPYENWVRRLEAQGDIRINDLQVRCIDRDSSGDIEGVRLKVEAYDSSSGGGEKSQLPEEDIYLQAQQAIVMIIFECEGVQHLVVIRRPNLAVGMVTGCASLPRALEHPDREFHSPDLSKVEEACKIKLAKDNLLDLNGLSYRGDVPSLYMSPASTSGSFSTWLYRQSLHPDRFNNLKESIAANNRPGEFVTVETVELGKATSSVRDVPSLAALSLFFQLDNRVPTQTVTAERPPTPPPPMPEPAPQYTEEELEAQLAALEAEKAREQQQDQDEKEEEDEDADD